MTPSDRFQKVVPKGGSALSAGTVEPPLALTDVSLRHGGAVKEVPGSDSSGSVPVAGTDRHGDGASEGVSSKHTFARDLQRFMCRSVGCRFLTQSGWLCRRHEGLVR